MEGGRGGRKEGGKEQGMEGGRKGEREGEDRKKSKGREREYENTQNSCIISYDAYLLKEYFCSLSSIDIWSS